MSDFVLRMSNLSNLVLRMSDLSDLSKSTPPHSLITSCSVLWVQYDRCNTVSVVLVRGTMTCRFHVRGCAGALLGVWRSSDIGFSSHAALTMVSKYFSWSPELGVGLV